MATIGDTPASVRAYYTSLAAAYINGHKQPGEAIGVTVEPTRTDGWVAVVKIGDVGVSGRLGEDPSDDDIRAALARLLEDARNQAQRGDDVTARRLRGRRG